MYFPVYQFVEWKDVVIISKIYMKEFILYSFEDK